MADLPNPHSLKSVSLKFTQKEIEPPKIGPVGRPYPSPDRDRPQQGTGFTATRLAASTSLQILTEVIELAHQEKLSDPQAQAGRFVYINGGGSTRPCERWGKLSGDAL